MVGMDGSDDWTYARLTAAMRGVATGLRDLGLAPGDRMLMRLGNTPDFPISYLGAIAAGIIPVPTSDKLTAPEVTRIAAEIKPALVVGDGTAAMPDGNWRSIHRQDIENMFSLPPADYAFGDPHRPAYIIYTSGTSGKPRAVVHAHRAVWARRMMVADWLDIGPDDRLLHAGAFNWTYTLGVGLMDPWAVGATALIPQTGTASTDLPALLATHKATVFAAAPGVYRQMLRQSLPEMPDLRHGLSAGEKLPEALRTQWTAATRTPLCEAYGMSECSTFLSGSPTHAVPNGALGYPQRGRRIAILGEDGPVTIGEQGVIAVHRSDPGLMLGYLDQPDETAAKFQGEWFLTGDVGRMDATKAITYEGRNDDMMNAGGFRVSPVEVEEALTTHPAITECAAVELRVKADTTVIAAFYVAAKPVKDETLAAHLADRLARYKTPRMFIPVDHLPRGANNKLLRRTLRQDWEAEHGQA